MGPRRGSPNAKGKLCAGRGEGGRRGLRLRCGGREGARRRKGKAARGGRELASRRQGDGGGVRLPRGNAGRSRRAWSGRLAEAAGAAGGGAARPKRRLQPPGTAPSSALRTRGEGGGVEKGPMRRELEGGPGVTHRLSRGRRSACPPKPLGPLLPLLFCRRRRHRIPLPPPPPELEPEPELEPPPLPPPPPIPPLPRQLQPRARAHARAPAPAVRVPGAAPPLVHSRS